MRARYSIPALLCSVLAAATACDTSPTDPGSPPTPGGPPISLAVAPSTATIRGGATLRLYLRAREDGHVATPSGIVWTTSNAKIATIADGLVTGRGVGQARITARWNGVNGASTVTVTGSESTGPAPCGRDGAADGKKAPELSLEKSCLVP